MIKTYFDEKAAIWDETVAEKNTAKLEALAKWMDIDPGSTVLDVGTGTGIFVPYILRKIGSTGKLVCLDLSNEMLKRCIDKGYKGIVIAGTGLGHVSTEVYGSVERAIQEGLTVLMTVQTLHGFTGMNVYSTGRELQNLGVIPGENILPEVGYVKLGWVLGQTSNKEEIRTLMLTNLAGEILKKEIPIAFNYDIDRLLKEKKL